MTTFPAMTITSGVRRSETPRRKPWPPIARNADGIPSAAIRRYVTAYAAVCPSTPIASNDGLGQRGDRESDETPERK